jgi:putative holliday junction resolvase
MEGRILAVDIGEKHIGLALSDLTGTIAAPLAVIEHVNRLIDAAQIAQLSSEHQVMQIVVGIPVNEDNRESPQTRHVMKFITALKEQSSIPVVTWDESFSTNTAQRVRQQMGVSKKDRSGHLDDLAAAIILQSYLDSQNLEPA